MPGTMHRSPSTGTATRSVPTAALTAAIQPSRSTTAAGPGTPRRSGAATDPQRLEAGFALPPEVDLRQPHRHADQRDRRRVHGRRRPGDVDDPQQRAGPRVVHRGRGARPRVQAALVVLGGEQLHRGTLDERGADRVRAHGGLGPGRALGEAERVGAVPDPVAAVSPQHDAVRVGDDHDVLRLVGDRGEVGPQPGQHACERAGAAPLLQRLDPDRAIGRRPVGIVPVGAHPRPRPRHDAARAGRQRVPGQHRLVGAVQQVGMTTQVDSPAHRADRVVHALILRRGLLPSQRQDVRASQSVIRLLISSGRSTSMKCPTPSISSESEPGPA